MGGDPINSKRPLFKFAVQTLAVCAVLFGAFLALRHPIAEWTIRRIADRIETKYHLKLVTEGARLSSWSGIAIDKIRVESPNGGPLAAFKGVYIGFKASSLLFGELRAEEMVVEESTVWIQKEEEIDSFDRFVRKIYQEYSPELAHKSNYAATLSDIIDTAFHQTPKNLLATNITLFLSLDASYIQIEIPRLTMVERVIDTEGTINGIPTQLHMAYDTDHNKLLQLNFATPSISAQKLIDALPAGAFDSLQGMKINGSMTFTMDFSIGLTPPYEVTLEPHLETSGLEIVKMGKADLRKMNGSFSYPIYRDGELIRTIDISPKNPDFIPFDKIPTILINALIASEDLSFRQHKGFSQTAFAHAFQENLRAGKFKYGASTITMQVVKNLYLSSRKTIGRKLEEIMLVWLIENLGLVSKDNILQTYLNIAEFGPNIYGIGEASRFYFNKRPEELTEEESLFLIYLLPSPKNYADAREPNGDFKPEVKEYFKRITTILQKYRLY